MYLNKILKSPNKLTFISTDLFLVVTRTQPSLTIQMVCSKITDLVFRFSDSWLITPLFTSIVTCDYVTEIPKILFAPEVQLAPTENVVMHHHLKLLNAVINFLLVLLCIGKKLTTKLTKDKVSLCYHVGIRLLK